jgi:hypothetical protein
MEPEPRGGVSSVDETTEERLARAIKAFEFAHEHPESAAQLMAAVTEISGRKSPGDPFNESIDQLVAYMVGNPELTQGASMTDLAAGYLRIAAEHVRTMVAEKVNPSLDDPATLAIEVEEDWRLDASVEDEEPYTIYISTNLFMFCATVSEYLSTGLGLDVVDDDQVSEFQAAPRLSSEEVARGIRRVLASFAADQTIPRSDVELNAAHTIFSQILFHSVTAFVVCHEFGHVVARVKKNAGEPPPFSDRADEQLGSNLYDLIQSGRHDPDDRAGLRRGSPLALRDVRQSWEQELTADLIGVSLASEYMLQRGPWKEKPGVLGLAYLGFHLLFLSLTMLYVYLHQQRPDFVLLSKTHPPVDFRMHCLLEWMYSRPDFEGGPVVPYGDKDAYKLVTEYANGVMAKVFA